MVNNFPDLNINTGFLQSQTPSDSAISLSLIKAEAGHRIDPFIGYNSINFPSKAVVFVYGMNIITSFSLKNFTLPQSRPVLGSNVFSFGDRISPILHDEKKLVVQADQKTCFAKSLHSNLLILCPRIVNKLISIGIRIVADFSPGSQKFFAPLTTIFVHASELRLG